MKKLIYGPVALGFSNRCITHIKVSIKNPFVYFKMQKYTVNDILYAMFFKCNVLEKL